MRAASRPSADAGMQACHWRPTRQCKKRHTGRATHGQASCPWHPAKVTALVTSLGVSAYSMAVALGSPDHWWVGWVALLPLFISIRVLAPAKAMLAGAFWGLSLFVFLATTGDSGLTPGVGGLVLLAGVPAVYTWLGARLTRQVGFSPYLLALGWMGVELALSPLGLRNGLLASTQSDSLVIHWVGNFAGCVLVAFLVAYISASVFEGVNRACVAIDRRRYVTGAVDAARRLFPLEVPHYPSLCGKPAQPRAPPMHLGVPCA